ncbi:MAG: FAD binding domain-containing protein [Spirochaetes bacterium]|nr:FAD binding domain-containing protein [Spirochaetota bacterium]
MPEHDVFVPSGVVEILAVMKQHPDSLLVAGATSIMASATGRSAALSPVVVSLERAQELKAISRTDRFVEFGAMTTLSELLSLRKGTVPSILKERAAGIGTFTVRNLATLGGALSCATRFRDVFAPLACLDALAEFRTPQGSSWVNVNRLAGENGRPVIRPGSLLTRIRIPADEWDFAISRRYGLDGYESERNAVLSCVCRMNKHTISEIRIAEAGAELVRSREAETMLIGRKLPLAERDKDAALEAYAGRCAALGLSGVRTARFLGVLRTLFECLDRGEE